MVEIEEIIRKMTNTVADTEKKVKEQKESKKRNNAAGVQRSWGPLNVGTPAASSSVKRQLVDGDSNEALKMQTAAANVAPHRLGQMQKAAEEIEPIAPVVNND